MAQFMLSVFHDAGVQSAGAAYPSEEEAAAAFKKVETFNNQLKADGVLAFVGALTPPENSSVVSLDGTVTNGPAAAGARALGGFWVVDTTDHQSALALAQRAAEACGQPVEIRPFEG